MPALLQKVRSLCKEFGPTKPMGLASPRPDRPHYFLHRCFASDQDLLIIFNTKRCKYQCHFCQLPAKCSADWIPLEDILSQFEFVMTEMKHSLSVLNRLTVSNDGSVLDSSTFPSDGLIDIARCTRELRSLGRIVLETRIEFVDVGFIEQIRQTNSRLVIDILVGFETLDERVRDTILFKRESISTFLSGLDRVQECGAELTCYILYKPDPQMADEGAYEEARQSAQFLSGECARRGIPLFIRLNPMYKASGSKWALMARENPTYKPPKLTDVMRLAEELVSNGTRVYIGLSGEGLDDREGNYRFREDYSSALIRPILMFNAGKIKSFDQVS